jgi:hypothetical protein
MIRASKAAEANKLDALSSASVCLKYFPSPRDPLAFAQQVPTALFRFLGNTGCSRAAAFASFSKHLRTET